MSRGGGRGGRGGFGRGRGGAGGGFGQSSMPPMGLTFADIQAISREPSALYPPMESLPVLTEYSAEEKRVAELQAGFATRMRRSPYYIVEHTKSTDLPRFSDKYRTTAHSQPPLRKKDLNQPFFPPDIFEEYFNPKKKRRTTAAQPGARVNLDDMVEDGEDAEKEGEEKSEAGSQIDDQDYDVDEEFDNDYAENYFDNGEADEADDLGGGAGGGEDGGGPADYD